MLPVAIVWLTLYYQNGSLAVQGGRDIIPTINSLLELPFALKAATKDFHPQDHISFASNHPPPNNIPFESEVVIQNPLNEFETQKTRLWPDHCVQGTAGSELVPELNISKVDEVVEKGMDKRVEMYSVFQDPFTKPTVFKSRMADLLRENSVTDVFVCGLAHDYCVKYTAIDAAQEGFKTYVVEDATKAVDPKGLPGVNAEMAKYSVTLVTSDGPELAMVGK